MKRKIIYSIALCWFAGSSFAQIDSLDIARIDRNELIHWVDSIITSGMKQYTIPGVGFAFVANNEVFFSKGYGYANLTDSIPINPATTHFDMGSIPKALTAVAALQLIESGKLALHEPISKWIPGLSREDKFTNPITLHHLLTHTAGLDDVSNIGSASKSFRKVPDLQDFIKSTAPIQVLETGQVISYSNIGYAIIGRLIEIASGEPFANYMHKNVLNPLKMNHSSFKSQLTDEMESHRALGYEYIDGRYQAAPINYQFNTPAAGLRSTVLDMANFIIMQLNHGRFGERQLVSSDMLNEMQKLQFTNHPDLQGLGYSLREEHYDGWRIMGQNGGWQGFNHDFYLIKPLGIGMIVCLNGDDGSQIGSALIEGFVKNFLPKRKVIQPKIEPVKDIHEYVGIYRSNRYSRNSITKFGVLLGFVSELEISLKNDSLYYYDTPLLYEGNDVFRRADGVGQLAFLRNITGDIKGMARSYSHYDANEKLSWFETSSTQQLFYVLILIAQLIVLILSIIQLIKHSKKSDNKVFKMAILIQLGSVLCSIGLIVGFLMEFAAVGAWDFQYGATVTLKILLTIPFILIFTLLIKVYFLVRFFQKMESNFFRVTFVFSTVALSLFLLFLHHWNFIGYNY